MFGEDNTPGIGGCQMRGRKPRELNVDANDRSVLEEIARSRTLPWFQVERARIVLALAAGERIQELAARQDFDRTTIWRLCRRYEERGVDGLLSEDPRTGRPPRISPPPTIANR